MSAELKNGVVAGVRGIARDVSDRHRSEERQRHYFGELQTINQIGQQIASELDLDELLPLITRPGGERPAVLDLGCGCGIPVARRLASTCAVTGVASRLYRSNERRNWSLTPYFSARI